jgi:hypothetical protein
MWGDPHFIVGHFGHVVEVIRGWVVVAIERGPNGPPDPRVYTRGQPLDGDNQWPMYAGELEAVD